jgi:hypothetical protein
MKNYGWCGLLLMVIVAAACASITGGHDWQSRPTVQTEKGPLVDVRLEPLKNGKRFFVAFRLDITNHSAHQVSIDWNKTRYLHNGRTNGAFVFRGIDPAAIKAAIPPDTIAPGATFSREIFPAHLVAFTPMREEVLDAKGQGLFPGPLPAGENGIRLIITKNGEETVQDLAVDIH